VGLSAVQLQGPGETRMLRPQAKGARMKPSKRSRMAFIVAGVLAAAMAAAPALADCYDVVGCSDKNLFSKNFGYLSSRSDGPSCDFLYMMRNRIYAQHGYCFTTARGVSEIGNAGCHITSQSAVPLSNIERDNIATLEKAETAKSCPK
jgi:hypothetical protein